MWIGTALGLTYHNDAGRPPQIAIARVLVDNQPCDASCREAGLGYRSQAAVLTFVGTDLADPVGVRYEVEVEMAGPSGLSRETSRLAPDSSFTLDLAEGTTYSIRVRAVDRNFNASSYTDPVSFQVKAPAWWQRILDDPVWRAVLLFAIVALVPGSIYSYSLYRRSRRYGFVDVVTTLTAGGAPGEVQVELQGGRAELAYSRSLNLEGLQAVDDQLRRDAASGSALPELGSALMEGLFSPEALTELKAQGLGRRGVRLRLRMHGLPQVAALPWEFLREPDAGAALAVGSHVAVVRDLSQDGGDPARTVRPPLRVLIAWANPADRAQLLDIGDEVNAIRDALRPQAGKRGAEVVEAGHATIEAFVSRVQEGFDLVHFIGHGGLSGGAGALYLEDAGGFAVTFPQSEAVALLGGPAQTDLKRPNLVVLNACRTADAARAEGLLSLAAALVEEGGLPAAIGMGYPISTHSAVLFSRAFYQTLVRHGQVDHAVTAGREALVAQVGADLRDWGVPRLYSRVSEGVILELI